LKQDNTDWVNASIYEKLNLIQTGLVSLKDQTNVFGDFNYRSAEQILSLLKPFLEITGTVIVLSDEIISVNNRNYIKSIATFTDGSLDDEGKQNVIQTVGLAREAEQRKAMDVSQLTGSTSSYARKYALGGLFAIDDNKDADSMDNREQTHHNGAEVKGDGFITIEQSLKMERMSRDRYTMPNDAAMLKSIAKDGYAITAAEAQIHINAVLAGQEQNKPVSKSQKEDLIGELESLKKDKRINKEVYKNMTGYLEESNYSHKAVASVVDGINKVKKEGEVKNGK